MNKKIKIAYETMGTSSYVSITCPQELDLVHYQLETLLSNDIKNLLVVSKQLVDGETVLYYKITSQLPLSQVLEKRKLKRNELLNLIEGIAQAVQDASAYRLPADGILLEPGYIYVNPASCKPSFLYFPAEQESEWDVKELVAYLIMHDQIEMANDNLIQVLLQELNREPFSLKSLEESLRQGNSGRAQGKLVQKTSQQEISRVSMVQPSGNSINRQENRGENEYRQIESPSVQRAEVLQQVSGEDRQAKMVGERSPEEKKPTIKKPTVKKPVGKKPAEPKTEERKAKDSSQEGFDAERAKKLFMLPQAALMLITAAAVSFGLFTDKAGKIAVNTILAFFIFIAVTEVILYREVFVNAKKAGKPKEKKAEKQKKGSKQKTMEKQEKSDKFHNAGKPVPPRPLPPTALGDVHPVQAHPGNVHPVQMPEEEAVLSARKNDELPYVFEPKRIESVFHDDADTDIGSETELWDGTMEEGMEAYLEYYEGSHVVKIPISSTGSTIIGRLESQVDFAVKNPKVGKVHAKFYGQDNQYFVVDINSKNGTYINGSRTRIESNSPFLLHDQDRITLADTEFIIRCARD